eukprot:3417989-Lingulodinium_polyedra.AAC.1
MLAPVLIAEAHPLALALALAMAGQRHELPAGRKGSWLLAASRRPRSYASSRNPCSYASFNARSKPSA